MWQYKGVYFKKILYVSVGSQGEAKLSTAVIAGSVAAVVAVIIIIVTVVAIICKM